MAAFTAVTDGFAPQTFMAEIVDAVNERRLAAIASGATGLPDAIPAASPSLQSFQGGDVKPVHLLIQELLEALAPKYLDHDAATPVATPYTLATWRTAAGIHASGFKRATAWANPAADPTFGYGLIQTGDIAGYWIWVEIVAGLRALKWTRIAAGILALESRYGNGSGASVAAAISDGDTNWAAAAWSAGGSGIVRSFYVTIGSSAPYTSAVVAWRSKLKVFLAANAPVAAACSFWIEVGLLSTYSFYDPESWLQGWHLAETVAVAVSDPTVTMANFTMMAPTNTPLASSGIGAGGNAGSLAKTTHYAVFNWSFTHT